MSDHVARRRPPNAGKGRKKGALNKYTTSVKSALTAAFDERGGVPALLQWAAKNETEFYRLWGRLAPTEIVGDPSRPVALQVTFSRE